MQLHKDKTKFFITDLKREKKYDYKSYTRNDGQGPRTYNVGEKKIPSVTTILSATQSEERRKKLDEWRAREGYKQAQAITNQAARRGTEMHYVLEQYINGVGYLNLSEEGAHARMMAHEIIVNLEPLKVVWGNEVSLAYKDQWAGSTDVVGVHSDKPYQIAAYSLAHKEQYGPIEQGLICICTKDKLYQEFKMDKVMLEEYEKKWFERVKKYYSKI